MKNYYKLMLLSALSFFTMHSNAQQVSIEDAQAKALSFLNQPAQVKARKSKSQVSNVNLAYTGRIGTEKHFYVFNSNTNDGGFVIVGADQSAKEILGYSRTGSFDYASAPDNFKWWLSQYSNSIHSAISDVNAGKLMLNTTSENAKARRKAANRTSIPELIKTKWNQSEPFNNSIPYTTQKMVTGCVATAMAQVMKYHEYPTMGTGSHSYTHSNYSYINLTANFGNTTYKWNNMLDDYESNSYNIEQSNAVATLMYHCGVSVNMNYGSSGSSASSSDIPYALSTYFGYDKSAECIKRDYYTDEEWLDIVYNELKSNRPVLYGGQDAYGGGGHEFICHGYDASNQTFAINWGWGGYCDGYFTLIGVNGLQPEGNGIGGAGYGSSYTSQQDIIINVMPDKGGKEPFVILCNSTYWGKPKLTDVNSNVTNSATLDLSQINQTVKYEFYPWNRSNSSKNIQTTVMLKDVVSGACIYTNNVSQSHSLAINGLYQQTINITSSDIPFNGTYEVYPMVRETGTTEWQRLRVPTSVSVPTIKAVGGEDPTKKDITFEISNTTVEERGTLSITHDKFYDGEITYTATPSGIVNIDANGIVTGLKVGNAKIIVKGEASSYFNETTTEFNITVTPYIKKNIEFDIDDTYVMVGKTISISHIAPNYTGTFTYNSSDNNIASVDANGIITGVTKGKATITVNASEDDLYKQTTKSFTIDVEEPGFIVSDILIANNGYMTPSTVTITATFTNQSGNNYSEGYKISCKYKVGGFTGTSGMTYTPWNDGRSHTITFDASNWESYFKNYIGYTGQISFIDPNGNVMCDPIPFTICDDLSIDYTMSSANWGTICLPFDAEVPNGCVAYTVTSTNGKNLVKEEVSKLEMNKPYLINGPERTYNFTGPDTPTEMNLKNGILYGNTLNSTESDPVYAPKDSYVLQNNTEGLGFYHVSQQNAQKIRQYSAYLIPETNTYSNYFSFINDVTSINSEKTEDVQGQAYTINGIMTNRNAKGLVIVNGKLMFNK